MTQALFTFAPPKAAPAQTEQQKQLARVSGRISEAVLAWCRRRITERRDFRMAELTAAVGLEVDVAPDSPRRIFSLLREEGRIKATLLSRSGSLFRLDEVSDV